MTLTESRRNEIAYILFRRQLQNKIKLSNNRTQRELGDVSKKTDVPVDELNTFFKDLVIELANETFVAKNKDKVKIL